MTRSVRWAVLATAVLAAAALVPLAAARADDLPVWPPQPAQPDAGQRETTAQACERCARNRSSCKRACAGPDGRDIPSDYCLDQCDNSYWRCVPAGHDCS